jgi:Tic22-like family
MKLSMHLSVVLLILSILRVVNAKKSLSLSNLWIQARRVANLSHTFGSQQVTAKTPYERIASHPVFQVTTSWGAPYMNFEKIERSDDDATADKMGQETRPITLFYMDPEDAVQMHEEMKHMDNMKNSDIRITTTTLAKAIRQAANFGNGLPTGAPVDPMTGNLKSAGEGGSLRYKIVPSKRQLFYAARCKGRERVGLMGTTPMEDAAQVLEGNAAINAANLARRVSKTKTATDKKVAHMEGYTGIPVFCAPEMRRSHPLHKRLVSREQEIPFFFSYEDLMEAWSTMHQRSRGAAPAVPSEVEVFNLMDLLTSMDREESKKHRRFSFFKDPVNSLKNSLRTEKTGLEGITFIPPSNCIEYKERASREGNGKARLRPMR